jgi:hypothetical protein
MAGSWREILESAAAVERADAKGSVHPGEARYDAESQGGEQPTSTEFHPPAKSRGFGQPELAAFLTRLATPPDASSAALAEGGAVPPHGRRAPSRERPSGNSLVVAVGAAKAPAEAEKAAAPAYTQQPLSRERHPWRGLLATVLLAGTVGLSAYALLIPGGKTPDPNLSSQNPTVIEASRVRERPSHSRRSRALRARHKRAEAARARVFRRCAYDPDLPVCRWRRFRDR